MSALKVSLVTKAKEETASFTEGVFPSECEVLFQTEEELRAGIADIDVMIPGHITVDGDLIGQGTNLKLIHAGTGYNNVDMDAANKNGTYVAVTPNVAAQSVAELVFSGFGALKNQIRHWDNIMKDGGWKTSDFIGVPEFQGKTLGVVGYGNIGKCAGKIGRGFGMNVIAHDPYCKDTGDGTELVDMDKLLSESDYITLHVLLTDETKGYFNKEKFASMKETAYIANACRGPVIKESDLIEALQTNQIAGACIDVMEVEPLPKDSPLRSLDNVMLTPHIAYCSNEALLGRYAFFADNCQKIIDGDVPKMAVNAEQIEKG
jgi:D-3-phosphoglycerate dehydrogenase